MRLHLSHFIIFALLHIGAAHASTVTQTNAWEDHKSFGLNATPNNSLKTHMLVLKCPENAKQISMSRVTVLDLKDDGSMDTALVTGHGLTNPDGTLAKGCFVQDFNGRSRPVEAMRLAPNYRSGTSSDWGLITFRRIRTKNLVRYPLEAVEVTSRDAATRLLATRFSTARGRPENGQNCDIFPEKYSDLDTDVFAGLLTHNCHAIGGQSGSPFSSRRDELLGIHIGTTWTLRSRITGRPAHQGYLRVLDTSMVEEISILAQDMKGADK